MVNLDVELLFNRPVGLFGEGDELFDFPALRHPFAGDWIDDAGGDGPCAGQLCAADELEAVAELLHAPCQ